MKKLINATILSVVALFSAFSFANPNDSCDGEQTIFDAYTIKGDKHVGVCYVHGNVRYVYGKDENPEVLINVPREKIEFNQSGNGDQSVTIPDGDYNYIVGEYIRGGPFIQVWKGQNFVTEIKLSENTLENNIERYSN
ncbi:TPA: hypothetical protein LVL12_000462 [Klebsiella oxytoca]|nr:hypothetical protein [Klebsiella oxytoca]